MHVCSIGTGSGFFTGKLSPPSECLYVGDHLRDIQAGNAAGMDTAAALWGYISENEQTDQWKAKFMVNSPDGLLRLVKEKHAEA